jgi:hypothetical protein
MDAIRDLLHGVKSVKMLEHADLVHTDTEVYVDRQGYDEVVIEFDIGALTGIDGSNYVTPSLQAATASPTASGSYSAVAAADMDYEIVTASGVSSEVAATVIPKVDDAAEDSVIIRARYRGTSRYVSAKLTYTGAGISAGVIGVKALLAAPRKGLANANSITIGAVV